MNNWIDWYKNVKIVKKNKIIKFLNQIIINVFANNNSSDNNSIQLLQHYDVEYMYKKICSESLVQK